MVPFIAVIYNCTSGHLSDQPNSLSTPPGPRPIWGIPLLAASSYVIFSSCAPILLSGAFPLSPYHGVLIIGPIASVGNSHVSSSQMVVLPRRRYLTPKLSLPQIISASSATSQLPETRPSTMSTPWILHRLYTLDSSSLDFSRHLYSVIRHDEEEKYLSKLQGSELAQLLEFFDKVRAFHLTPCLTM